MLTSNIKDAPPEVMVVNYSDLINTSVDASDNSGIMLIKLLIKLSVKKVSLAGFDGFNRNQIHNYYSQSLVGMYDPLALEEKHLAINEQLNRCAELIQIHFVTPTKYKIS